MRYEPDAKYFQSQQVCGRLNSRVETSLGESLKLKTGIVWRKRPKWSHYLRSFTFVFAITRVMSMWVFG